MYFSYLNQIGVNMSKALSLAQNLKSAPPSKKIKNMGTIRSNCRSDPSCISSVARYIIPLLLDGNGEVRLTASKLILEFSKLNTRATGGEMGRLIDTLKKAFARNAKDEEINWEPFANALLAAGNVAEKFPDFGVKSLPLMTQTLKYPIYHPERPLEGLHLLYAASMKAIGKVGAVAPLHVKEEAVPLVYKALVDSFRFNFWLKPLKNKDEDMKYCAIQTLTRVGIVAPAVVVPTVVWAFMDKDKKLIKTVRDVLFMLGENLKMLFPALMDALEVEKKKLREYITEFIVELGERHPDFMIPQLTYRMEDERKFVRFHCGAALGSLFPNNPQFIPAVIPVLIDHLANDKDLDVRQTVSDSLNVISKVNVGIYQEYISNIIAAMDDEYHHVRWRMAQIVMNVGKVRPDSVNEAIPYLIAGLDDRHDHVGWKCQEALDVLKVDKIVYQLTVRNIKVGRSLIVKAKEIANVDLPEEAKMLDEAAGLARSYRFQESIELAGKAKKIIERKVPHLAEGGSMPFPGQMPPGYMQMPGYGQQMPYPQGQMPQPGYFGPHPGVNQAQQTPDKNKENSEKYRRGLKRALKDGIITQDEEEMLAELRDMLDISMEVHNELLAEEIPSSPPPAEPESKVEEQLSPLPAPDVDEDAGTEAVNWDEMETWGGDGNDGFDLENGYTYLLEDEEPNEAFTYLFDALDSGRKGFYVTRNHPRKVSRKYKLEKASYLWLTKMPGENNLRPSQLAKINQFSEGFLKNSPGGLMVIEGLEYLATHNGFEAVLSMVQSLKDLASVTEGILIISVSPSAMEKGQLKNLEREVDSILE